MKEYKKLLKAEDYNHEVVEELAEAMMERTQLRQRLAYLEELIEENHEIAQFIWTTKEGIALPHHKITDDHLKNILTYIASMGRSIPKAVKAEARKRGLEVPTSGMIEAEIVEKSAQRYLEMMTEEDRF